MQMLEDATNPPASQCKMHLDPDLDAAELSTSGHQENTKSFENMPNMMLMLPSSLLITQ